MIESSSYPTIFLSKLTIASMIYYKASSDTQQWVNWFANIPAVMRYHYKEGNMNLPMIMRMVLLHAIAAKGAHSVSECSIDTIFWATILSPIRSVEINQENQFVRKQNLTCLLPNSCHAQWFGDHSWGSPIMVP